MKKIFKLTIYLIIIITIIFTLISCKSIFVMDSNDKYEKNQNSNKAEITFKIKTDKKGQIWGELTSPLIYPAIITGQIKEETDDLIFIVDSVKYTANWPNGWTYGQNDAYGKLRFKRNNEKVTCITEEKIDIFELKEGELRYQNDYYRGEDGLLKVKQRIDRINAVISFLKENNFRDFYGNFKKDTLYGPSFKSEITPFLFPEKANFKKLEKTNKLPNEYYENVTYVTKNDETTDINKDLTTDINIDTTSDMSLDTTNDRYKFKYRFNSGVFWNTEYTKKVFPENLQPIRNSGSMWRDFEESLQLYFMFYNFDYFMENILNNASFIIVKE